MLRNAMSSRTRSSARALLGCGAVLSLFALAGCSGNPPTGSPAYKEGKLGNGSFLFKCDDSVACDRWSTNDAKDFPTQIATGSSFNLRFVADGQEGDSLNIQGRRYDGVTLAPVGPYVGSGPDGFAALKPGYGTVYARDSRGAVIDYVTLKIVKPNALVVYRADYKGLEPPSVQKVEATVGQSQSFRTVAMYDGEAVAGSVRVQWESESSEIAEVQNYRSGVVSILAKAPGTTKVTAVGAGLTKTIDVEVKEVAQ
jgi:hypothetical protein